MAIVDPALLSSPVTETDPCGPDLDETGDAAFMNFFAFAPFQLPDTFFSDGRPFDPTDAEFREATEYIPAMLADVMKRTRDLRLMVFLARLAILRRNLDEFVDTVAAMATLLERQWEALHPRPRDGSVKARADILDELDSSVVTISLQFVTIHSDRRKGNIAYRSTVLAEQEKAAEGGEGGEKPAGGRLAAMTQEQIVRALVEAGEQAVGATRASFRRLEAALKEIRARFLAQAGGAETPEFGQLLKVVGGVLTFFSLAFPDPTAPEPQEGEEGEGAADAPRGAIACAAHARRALEAAKDYFCFYEPSNPALPLVAQAIGLQGKTFIEVLAALLPERHAYAQFAIGGEHPFKLAIAPLGEMTPTRAEYFDERQGPRKTRRRRVVQPASTPRELEAPTPIEDETPPIAEETFAPADDAQASQTENAAPEESAAEDFAPESAPDEVPVVVAEPAFEEIEEEEIEEHVSDAPNFTASTRTQALLLLDEIARYFRLAEPSSPIPCLIDRARALADKDFIAVLGAVFERENAY
ncbi:type VI secretion system ImpA family N-terminal domain-containing protein [Methylosinus sp. H3A]|uniref:type VI secretion system ImpA family N-terminal domain-containing protein n=1 Tax=Methylosinus sp. H3A TaxID=2785786 RepID=UPI0018C281FE|nr:type VI secretion system ImpA family N-terminal domain-containing protein [Methylosinus sp. H3A]MBG0809510.1 type VI secretion system ImpA family N-terminal domain-containing protein [Methylosinus sp. H3A]